MFEADLLARRDKAQTRVCDLVNDQRSPFRKGKVSLNYGISREICGSDRSTDDIAGIGRLTADSVNA